MAPISQRKLPPLLPKARDGIARPHNIIGPSIDNIPRGKSRKSPTTFPLWAKLVTGSMVAYFVVILYFIGGISFHTQNRPGKTNSRPVTAEKTRKIYRKGSRRTPYMVPSFSFDRDKAELFLTWQGPSSIRKVISAFVEPPMIDTVPGTGSQGDVDNDKDYGFPPDFVVPLPLRTNTPADLKLYEYTQFKTCADMPGKLPVDRGLEYDANGNQVVRNVGNTPTSDDFPWTEAPFCPVEADPFLPWIHDMFPSIDGSKIEFVAQNKRRCKTGKLFLKDIKRLEPQVALLQHVSVDRIDERTARELAPELWHSDDLVDLPRYRLAPFNESAPDGQETRFICRFYGTDFSSGTPRSIIIGETLSEYPFNYEFVSYRKMRPTMITPKGKDTKYFWTSNLRFECPVPDIPGLRDQIASSSTILSDGSPTMHLDLIPIRTSPRFGLQEIYFTEDMAGPKNQWGIGGGKHKLGEEPTKPVEGFNAMTRWGYRHVLPRVEASGRWINLPICHPPKLLVNHESSNVGAVISKEEKGKSIKPHLLSACLWASASFKTRGKHRDPVLDTAQRLVEWIEFHLLVGFDHIYVYDNSGAHTNATSLAPVLERFPKSHVTHIDWPSIVCNNNIPAHDNTGERSSQYAAENSCRTRHAPFTEWIAAFDTDEYLVPVGKHTSLREVVIDAAKSKTNILSFRSTRSKLLLRESEEVGGDRRQKKVNSTFLEAYNCDGSSNPKPDWADRARKQVYRSDYVLYHFVHYSTVTQGITRTFKDQSGWTRSYHESSQSERITDEVNEAVMLHTKTTSTEQTSRWKMRCHHDFEKKWRGCNVGFPWPDGVEEQGDLSHDEDGMKYNCFQNKRITDYWVPKLREAMVARDMSVKQSVLSKLDFDIPKV